MSSEDLVRQLESTPITELSLGRVQVRRTIKKAGFETLPELLKLSEPEIDVLFDWDIADEVIKWQGLFRSDPEGFAASALEKPKVDRAVVEKALADAARETKKARAAQQTPKRTYASYAYYSGDGRGPLPPFPFSNTLRMYEERARETFDELDDRFQDVLVYQAFEEFSTELDELSDAFLELFAHYKDAPRVAISRIEQHLNNAFIVFVADRARSVFCEGNLWGNFFAGLGIEDGNTQGLFKQAFANHLERRGMPLYARDEEANYYFYTALLHGGLSADSWANLWSKSLLPLARELAMGHYGSGGEMDGHAILKELKNPESRFAPKKAVLNILEKAPDATFAPLFEASLRVVARFEEERRVKSDFTMLSNFGLPDVAMEALQAQQEKESGGSVSLGRGSSSGEKRDKSKMIYLPMGTLRLDLAVGEVSICWPKHQVPLEFAGAKIDYYVDGNLLLSAPLDISVGKCILGAASISVQPQPRYNVELKLMQRDGTGEFAVMKTLPQIFENSKPGCFEFIKDAKGLYRLRGKNERITRKRRIAYIVKEGFAVEPGQGMVAVSEYETSGSWDRTQIFIYDVEPGASGSIVNVSTGEEAAVWQERYVAKIDKRRIIGETAEGLDLYGYVPCGLGTNGGLPSVTIEAIDGLDALNDLDIVCLCDGKRVSIPRHVLWADANGDSNAAQIALVPQESGRFEWHIESCLIEARQKSAGGKSVFRYRFAVAPIQDFRLRSVSFEYGTAVADYSFQAVQDLSVTGIQGEAEHLNAWEHYGARTLLEDEFLRVRIASLDSGKVTDARLALAALDIQMPQRLVEKSKERPICLADVLDMGPSAGNFRITSYGWRINRAAMVFMGIKPMFFKKMNYPGEHEFNLFREADPFVQEKDERPRETSLCLSILYGDDVSEGYLKPAWTDIELLKCQKGIGISGWKLLARSDRSHFLKFDGSPVCDACFTFRREIGGKEVAKVPVAANSTELPLPENIARLLDARKRLIVEVAPADWLGDPQREFASVFSFGK